MSLLQKSIRLSSILFVLSIISGQSLFAQKKSISLKTGDLVIELSTDSKQIDQVWEKGISGIRSNVIIAFNEKPTKETISILKINGIELRHAISENIYETVLSKKPSTSLLEQYGIVGMSNLPAEIKFSKSIRDQLEELSGTEKVSVSVLLYEKENPDSAAIDLYKLGFSPFRKGFNDLGLFYGTIPAGNLKELAAITSVRFINLASGSPEPLNFREKGVFGTTMLTSPQSGRNLNGKGIVVGVGDNADPTSHLDLQNNVINRSPAPIGGSAHGTHVSGTISGDGSI